MTRKRDFSGFGATPTKPDQAKPTDSPVPPIPTQPLVPAPASRTRIVTSDRSDTHHDDKPSSPRKSSSKQRLTLSLPTKVAAMLRATAESEQRIYLDIILAAFMGHADGIEREFVTNSQKLGNSGSRRRAGAGRTQIPLNILKEDLQVLDQRAKALNLDRSAYVTELLLRELKR